MSRSGLRAVPKGREGKMVEREASLSVTWTSMALAESGRCHCVWNSGVCRRLANSRGSLGWSTVNFGRFQLLALQPLTIPTPVHVPRVACTQTLSARWAPRTRWLAYERSVLGSLIPASHRRGADTEVGSPCRGASEDQLHERSRVWPCRQSTVLLTRSLQQLDQQRDLFPSIF